MVIEEINSVQPPNDHPVEDLKTPNSDYSVDDIIKIQVKALRRNNHPFENAGIKTAYNFASPENRATTGPMERFERMVNNDKYSALVNHKGARIKEKEVKEDKAKHVVEVVSTDEEKVTYVFRTSKQDEGEWEGCWMTDSVTRKLGI